MQDPTAESRSMGDAGGSPPGTTEPSPPACTHSPDFCRKQAPNYLYRFTFNLGASTSLHTDSTAPLLEITYHAIDSILGRAVEAR